MTDKWIESALQTLIASVRKEMGEYKLYNVVPVLIKFLESLTNWYVRLNRNRLKGEADEENWEVSLNVLFDVLLKVNVLLSPQVPFITELMFQNMRLVLRPNSQLAEASIHHLRIAEVNERLLDPVVTEQMANFMAVVETARKLREQKKVSLKQPISSLTVINRREAVFVGLGPFLSYIRDEINVDDIRHEANVEKYVRLEALPNLPVLGPKFKGNKTFGEVQTAIKKLTTVELEKLRETGSIVIAGNTLETVFTIIIQSDLVIQEKFVNDNIKEDEAIGGDRIMYFHRYYRVLLDTRQSEELKVRGFAREIITRVQKLKKRAKLSTEDPVLIFYRFGANAKYLRLAVENEGKAIAAAVKKPFLSADDYLGLTDLVHDEGTIDEEEYHLKLTTPGPVFNQNSLKVLNSLFRNLSVNQESSLQGHF